MTTDKKPTNTNDELADLLSDFDDDSPGARAPAVMKKPEGLTEAASSELDDEFMDSLLDEADVAHGQSAASKAVVMPPSATPPPAPVAAAPKEVHAEPTATPPPSEATPVRPPPPAVRESSDSVDAPVMSDARDGALPPVAAVASAAAEPEAEEFEEADEDGESDASEEASPASVLTVPSLRPVPTKAFPHEQDASVRLVETQKRDSWVARAAWLKAEAEAVEDPDARARALLTVSELYAMAGDDAAARSLATEAREASSNVALAHRQLRGLLEREGESKAILDAIDAEARELPTPAAKSHSILLGAEIARVRLSDPDAAKKRYEQAARTAPSDPRAHLQKFCEALAAPDADPSAPSALPRISLPDSSALAPLGRAFAQVAAHRGTSPKTSRPAGTTYESLLRARSSLGKGDVASTLTNLAALSADPNLAGGVGWLSGSLAAAKKATRPKALAALKSVISGSHGDLARRSLAGLAIELGDAEAARAATAGAGEGSFEASDRIALAALTGGSRADAEPWIKALLGDSELSAITAAASASLGDPSEEGRTFYTVGSLRAKAAVTLGRLLAGATDRKDRSLSSDRDFDDAVLGYADVAPESSIARTLQLELDVDAGKGGRVGQVISAWPTDDLDRDRDQALAGALIAEVAGEPERARKDLDRARQTDAKHEGAARALAALSDPKGASKIIAELAESIGAGPRSAILLTEAAVRLIDGGGEPEDIEPLLRKASEAAPKLPFAIHLGERSARARGDRDALIEWLRARRGTSDDTLEQALDLVREALLVSATDAPAAAALMQQALQARPSDVGLRELYERLAPEPPADRAAWRAELGARSTGAEAARLALEAALEHERSGDLARAAADAAQAVAAGESLLAPICAFRCAIAGHGAGDLIDSLLPRARATDDPIERLEIYERLADLDELGRNDAANGLLWRKSILEQSPNHLPTLRRVASALMAAGRDEELEPVALEIARALEGPEAVAHAHLSARLRLRAGTWDDTREPVEIAYRHEPRGIWTLRQMGAHARASGKPALAMEVDRQLIGHTERPNEIATLSLRAAEAAVAIGDVDAARSLLNNAIEAVPQHFVAHLMMANVAEQAGDIPASASALEAAALVSSAPEEKAQNLYRAAVLWQDKEKELSRARHALEKVAEIDPSYEDVFQRLQAIYISEGARVELAALLERRLDAVTDPGERIEMEVLRGRALADVGDTAAAKRALSMALEANPNHVDALAAFASVSAAEEDWLDAERAWIHLARLLPDPAKQVEIYLRLGDLYDAKLPNPERAELAYQEILKRLPGDESARERLVELYKRTGDSARAIEQQTILINNVEAPEAKCRRTAELASIYEVTGDIKKAEATLLQARKTWPKDDLALGALARFYQRTNQTTALNVLLDRALADARRALSTGRFELQLFGTVATVAEMRGKVDAAKIAHGVVAALDGAEAAMEGAGDSAADPKLDDILAPDVITPAFRELLKKTGSLLDHAIPYDLTAVRSTALPPQQSEVAEKIRSIAAAYGFHDLHIQVSSVLGAVCIPASSHPATIVIGQPLLASTREDVKSFLIHRALKILQSNSGAFSRTAPIDLWPLLAAYLKAFSPSWTPQGVEPARLNEAYGKITKVLGSSHDPELGVLAADVIGTIGNRASTLNTAINGWGNRAALLAVGDPNVALSGIAWASGNVNAPPPSGKDRTTWIGRNAEARDLVVFLVSDAYAEARSRLGLGASSHDELAPSADASAE